MLRNNFSLGLQGYIYLCSGLYLFICLYRISLKKCSEYFNGYFTHSENEMAKCVSTHIFSHISIF